ncbi:MAG: PLP-dependent aminotransferase family protein [Clostridiales bacterium]|nr:PLP-dependent aminotransferase family protein [Clostridiales bacterium]
MIDLMIPLQGGKTVPYYEQIYLYIREEIRTGKIRRGEKMPSTRQLAAKLGISRSTTQLAYDQLTAEGYLEARPCRGYYAADIDLPFSMEKAQEAPSGAEGRSAGEAFLREESEKDNIRNNHPEKAEKEKILIDFSPRGIDLSRFPFNTWRKLSREILQDENKSLFVSGSPRGEENLRQAICDYLQASRGIPCRPEQLVVGAGSEYLLMLLWQILGNRQVAMEDPTYRQASRVMQGLGHTVIPVAMDRYGMRADLLEESGAEMAYIMPSHQFPTGAVMSVARRAEILAWADKKEDRYIIEDDYDSEFRYRGRPIPALCGSDRLGRVIYLGTFSKAVAPAIRVSYMVLPERLSKRYDEVCGFYASTVSRVDQAVLARFMEEGYFERHLNRMRGIYRAKHDCLLASLESLRGDFHISGEMAGLHVLLKSKQNSEETLRHLAAEKGVRVYGLSSYFLKPEQSQTVILGYANLTEEEICRGVELLKEAWCR